MPNTNLLANWTPGTIPPWYVQVGNHWEPPSTPTIVGRIGSPFDAFTIQDPSGQLYTRAKMPNREVYIEGLGWRPEEQGSLMYPDSPEGRAYSAASGFNWIDRTPKPTKPLTQADANAWLNKVGALSLGTMGNAYNALPSYNTPAATTQATQQLARANTPLFQPERDYNPLPNYYGRGTFAR